MKMKNVNKHYKYNKKMKINKKSPFKKIILSTLLCSSIILSSKYLIDLNSQKDNQNISKTNISTEKVSKTDEYSYDELVKEIDKRLENEESTTINTEIDQQEENTTIDINEEEKQEKKLVALTFDDGPSKYTSELIDILNENGVNATFFLIGTNISKYTDSIVKAYTSDNEIGIHSYSHTSFTKMTVEEIENEILITRNLLNEANVDYSNLVRPPYGSINEEVKNNIDVSFILWNVDTRDWESRDKDKIIAEVKESINDGSIILFHDTYQSTIDAIRELLPLLKDEYEFVTVSELFNRNELELENNKKYYKVNK